jgi:hypothetical protein
MTDVPLANASTTDWPNGSSKLMRWSSARGAQGFGAGRPARRAAIDHQAVVERGRNLLVVIVPLLGDAVDRRRVA